MQKYLEQQTGDNHSEIFKSIQHFPEMMSIFRDSQISYNHNGLKHSFFHSQLKQSELINSNQPQIQVSSVVQSEQIGDINDNVYQDIVDSLKKEVRREIILQQLIDAISKVQETMMHAQIEQSIDPQFNKIIGTILGIIKAQISQTQSLGKQNSQDVSLTNQSNSVMQQILQAIRNQMQSSQMNKSLEFVQPFQTFWDECTKNDGGKLKSVTDNHSNLQKNIKHLERKIKIKRFKDKKRVYQKKVSYDKRKINADNRLRINGRFISQEESKKIQDVLPNEQGLFNNKGNLNIEVYLPDNDKKQILKQVISQKFNGIETFQKQNEFGYNFVCKDKIIQRIDKLLQKRKNTKNNLDNEILNKIRQRKRIFYLVSKQNILTNSQYFIE